MAPISEIERQVYTDIYETYSRKLYGVCLHYVHDHDIAEDLLHDSFIVIFSSLDSLRNQSRLEPWMCSIVRNLALKHIRDLKRQPETNIDDVQLNVNEDNPPITPEITLDELLKAIDSLPEQYGNVFRLSVLEGLSHKEIGAILGIAPHSSSSNLTRAKQMLRKIITKNWGILMGFILFILGLVFLSFPKNQGDIIIAQSLEITSIHDEKAEILIAGLEPAKALKHLEFRSIPEIIEDCPIEELTNEEENNVQEVKEIRAESKDIHEEEYVQTYGDIDFDDLQETEKSRKTPKLTIGFSSSFGNSASGQNGFVSPGIQNPGDTNIPGTGDITTDVTNGNDQNEDEIQTNSILCRDGDLDIINAIRKYRHYMPISVTASATWYATDRLMITSGLQYTYLYSDISEPDKIYSQKIHYLGIPMKASWILLKSANFRLYVSAGTTFEFPIAGKSDGKPLDIPCQWSAGIGTGLQYNLSPNVGLYIEPELYRYFENGIQTKTIRTERPVTLSLPIGIRFSW